MMATALFLLLILTLNVSFSAHGFGSHQLQQQQQQRRRRRALLFIRQHQHAAAISSENDIHNSHNHTSETDIHYDHDDTTILQQQLGYLPPNFVRVVARTSPHHVPVTIQTYPLQGGAPRRQAKVSLQIGAPFPTLYWLTEPTINRAIANLERQGYVQRIETLIQQNATLAQRFRQCHAEYAHERWTSLDEADRVWLLGNSESSSAAKSMVAILRDSGIAGTNVTRGGFSTTTEESTGTSSSAAVETVEDDTTTTIIPSLKCLHTHYAHYRSTLHKNQQQQQQQQQQDPNNPQQLLQLNPVGEMVHRLLLQEFPELDL